MAIDVGFKILNIAVIKEAGKHKMVPEVGTAKKKKLLEWKCWLHLAILTVIRWDLFANLVAHLNSFNWGPSEKKFFRAVAMKTSLIREQSSNSRWVYCIHV